MMVKSNFKPKVSVEKQKEMVDLRKKIHSNKPKQYREEIESKYEYQYSPGPTKDPKDYLKNLREIKNE